MYIKMNVKGNPELFRRVVVRAESMGYKFYKSANYINLAYDFIYFYDDMDLAFGGGEQWFKNHSSKEVNPIHFLNSEFFDHPKIKGFDWDKRTNVQAITCSEFLKVREHNTENLTQQPGGYWSDDTNQTVIYNMSIRLTNVNWKECILRRSEVKQSEVKQSEVKQKNAITTPKISGVSIFENKDQIFYKRERTERTIRDQVSKQLLTDLGKPLILPEKIQHKINPLILPDYEPDYQDILNFKED